MVQKAYNDAAAVLTTPGTSTCAGIVAVEGAGVTVARIGGEAVKNSIAGGSTVAASASRLAGGTAAGFASGGSMIGGFAGHYGGKYAAEAAGLGNQGQQIAAESGNVTGSVGGGAVVGAFVAGPPGAVAGAAVGAVGYGVGKAVEGVVNCFVSDDRCDFGVGLGCCYECGACCQNRGCKRCNENYCEDCYSTHKH